MDILENIFIIAQVVTGLISVVLVLLQDGKEDGNVIVGNKGGSVGASKESKLANLTKIFGLAFIVFTIASSSVMLINR